MSNIPLMPHQRTAVNWLLSRGSGLLNHGTGTGKTATAVSYVVARPQTTRILIVAPVIVLDQWVREIDRFDHGATVTIIRGTPLERATLHAQASSHASPAKYAIIGYETLRQDYKRILAQQYDVAIYDEAHRAFANPRTKNFKIARHLKAASRVALTATPTPNGLENYFGIIDFVAPGTLGKNYYAFTMQYCHFHPKFRKIIGYRNKDGLLSYIEPWVHMVKKEDVLLDLPPLTESTLLFDLSKGEQTFYNTLKKEMRAELFNGEELIVTNPLTKLLRLKQVTNNIGTLTQDRTFVSAKYQTLLSVLEDKMLDPQVRILIFSSFSHNIEELATLLSHYNPVTLTGSVDHATRKDNVAKFRSGQTRLLLSTEAGGEGVELTEGNLIIMLDLPYSHSRYAQRVGRAHRKNQTSPVHVINLCARGTIDEWCSDLIAKKREMSETLEKYKASAHEIQELLT